MRVTLAATVVALGLTVQREASDPAAVARAIEQELAAAKVPGAAIAVVSGGQRYAAGYGQADADKATPMTAATLVHIGSVTKLFTAMAVASTYELRKLPLEAPVGKLLTGLAPRVAAVTMHQLLSQTAGLGDSPGGDGTSDEAALGSAARALGESDFVLPGGVVFSYSNRGYALAGATLEAVRQETFADALRSAVLTPLGMSASTMRPAEAMARAYARGHRTDGGKPATLQTAANDTRIWPAGYLWSNAEDMSRALEALLAGGRVRGAPGLTASVIARVTETHAPMPNVFVGGHYGYGLMIGRDRGMLFYEHGGTLPGYSSIVRIAPERGLGIGILTNLDNAPLRRIAQVVMGKAAGLPDPAPPARSETPVTPEEMKSLLGIYRNRGTAELTVRDGRVVLILDGGAPFGVTRIGDTRYLARPKPEIPGPEFVVQPAEGATPPYLHFALWAYAKDRGTKVPRYRIALNQVP